MEFEAVIGLEVHVQLRTKTKMFTRVPTGFGAPPNTLVDPVVLGLPGALPVLNHAAIEQSVRVGLIFGSQIPELCKWDRKNYFYPDSPKNYQISQYDQPLCVGGSVEIELPGPARNIMGEHHHVPLTRAHLEEDVGKLSHGDADSLIDYNRAGTPLLEIVSEPAMRSAAEAVAFLESLRMHLVEAGISDCDMEKGQMRCDANVSIRPVGSDKLNTRTEMKNLNSIRGVANAIEYEIRRQIRVVSRGEVIIQETRRWDADLARTTSMRSKEEAHDYRYFPDPDLPPVRFPRARLAELEAALPERVFDRQRRYMEQHGMPYTLTSVICFDHGLTRFFEEALRHYNRNPLQLANFIANELQRERAAAVGDGLLPLDEVKLRPAMLADLVAVLDEGLINKQVAREVISAMFGSGQSPRQIIAERGLAAIPPPDDEALLAICREVLAANPKAVEQFKSGNSKALNSLIGPVMRATEGRGQPQAIRQLLESLIA
jgi:aspartyl-tRNA(Asn)/glutamyl-tRNA(Gln) amidotransferase subunit B